MKHFVLVTCQRGGQDSILAYLALKEGSQKQNTNLKWFLPFKRLTAQKYLCDLYVGFDLSFFPHNNKSSDDTIYSIMPFEVQLIE